MKPASPEHMRDHPLSGKRVAVTGRITGYGREEVKARLRECGAQVSESVSRKTDFLFAGEDAGSKLQKAKDLGVEVVTDNRVREMLS